jgi:hypothetical protein
MYYAEGAPIAIVAPVSPPCKVLSMDHSIMLSRGDYLSKETDDFSDEKHYDFLYKTHFTDFDYSNVVFSLFDEINNRDTLILHKALALANIQWFPPVLCQKRLITLSH